MALAPTAVTAEDDGASRLAVFEPFLGTWSAVVNSESGATDVARWERALAGRAVRIRHSVNDGVYGGETFVMWDKARGELIYYYFTTAGFYTHGTMSFDGDGRLVSRETVEGHAAGVTEVRATQEVTPDGKLRVTTRMLRNGEWEERGEVLYAPAPEAEVVLPDTGP